MPAYPMVPAPTFGEFADIVREHYDGRLRTIDVQCNGEPHVIRYLERPIDGDVLLYVIEIEDDERMAPNQVRNACRRLHIGVEDFGLHLG